MRTRLKPNYLLLTIGFAFLWAAVNLIFIISQIYSLNNSFIVDTSTALQSLKSVYFSKPFLNTVPSGSYLSVHASEFLFILLPAFSLLQNFVSLYIIQLIITYSASVPIFLLAKRLFSDERSAFFLALVYIFFPYTSNNPFELLTLFVGLIIFSFYFLETKHYIAFSISFLLALSTMEFATLIGVSIGLYLLFICLLKVYKENRLSSNFIMRVKITVISFFRGLVSSNNAKLAVILIVASSIFYAVDSNIITYFSLGSHHITDNLNDLGVGIFPTLPSKIESYIQINSPTIFLSFLDPLALLELPWIIASGASSFAPYWSPSIYYSSYLIPFIVVSAIYGLKRLSDLAKDKKSRTKMLRFLSGLTLLISILLLVSTSLIPMEQGLSVTQTSNGFKIAQLAALIPPNESVHTGVSELPIVSAQAWNTWIYGSEQNYTLFNSSNGEPYNLSGNSLVAASGSYVLFSKNYEGSPKFNNFYVTGTLPSSSVFQPYTSNTNIFLPPGNYTLNLNISYSTIPIYKNTVNSGNYSLISLPENYAIIQPFSVDSPTNLTSINVPGHMYPGYYILQSMITKNMSASSEIAQDSVGRNQYNTQSLMFTYTNTFLLPNTTYYFWLWSSGVPGGLYIPAANNVTSGHSDTVIIYNGSGYDDYGYYFTSYSNLSRNDYGLTFTLVGSTENTSNLKVFPTSFLVAFGENVFNLSLLGPVNSEFRIHNSFPQSAGLTISSPFLNGDLARLSFTIVSESFVTSHRGGGVGTLLIWFLIIFLIFGVIALLSFLWTPIKKNRKIFNASKYTLCLSTLIFYILFGIFYYTDHFIIDILKALGALMLASLFLTLLYGNTLQYDEKNMDSVLSLTKRD